MIIWMHFGELLEIYIQICDSRIQTDNWFEGIKGTESLKRLTKIVCTLDITDP